MTPQAPAPTLSFRDQQLLDRAKEMKRRRDDAGHELLENEREWRRALEAGDPDAATYHQERVTRALRIIANNPI